MRYVAGMAPGWRTPPVAPGSPPATSPPRDSRPPPSPRDPEVASTVMLWKIAVAAMLARLAIPACRWPGRAGSAQAGPQVPGADRDDQDADQAADQGVGHAGLDPGSGVAASQAADAQGDACWPVRGHGAVLVDGQDGEGDDARYRGHERGGQGGGGDLRGRGGPSRSGWGPGSTRRRCRRFRRRSPPRRPGSPGPGQGSAGPGDRGPAGGMAGSAPARCRAASVPRRRPGRRRAGRAAVRPG